MSGGWGSGGWGSSGWGAGASGATLRLDAADVESENTFLLTFNQAVYFTGILDPFDGSDLAHYTIAAITTTIGSDGLPAREVNIAAVELANDEATIVRLTVDRPFSHYPCRYTASVVDLRTTTGDTLVPSASSLTFDAVKLADIPNTRDLIIGNRDIANPQTQQALLDPLPVTNMLAELGTIPVDSTGDYAFDEGITSYKKRVMRRLLADSFAHLPGYGLGLLRKLKMLDRPVDRAAIEAKAVEQIRLEPETEDVSVRIDAGRTPGLLVLRVRAKMASGQGVDLDVPVAVEVR